MIGAECKVWVQGWMFVIRGIKDVGLSQLHVRVQGSGFSQAAVAEVSGTAPGMESIRKTPQTRIGQMVKQNMHNPSCSCMFQSWILACCTIELPPACLMQAVAMPRMWDCPAWGPFGFLGEACGLRFLQVSRLQAGVAMPCCSLRPSLLEVSWNGTEMLQPSN